MNKILLVEDDETLGYILKEYLQMNDFKVTLQSDGKSGLKAFKKEKFDLCILDVMMPQMNGYQLAENLRNINEYVPFLFLTAKSLKVDILKGFKVGADDYIVKPVDEEELLARIQAILNRRQPITSKEEEYTIGKYVFDVNNQNLLLGTEERHLTERETMLLQMLSSQKGNLVSREYILKQIWGKSDYFTRRSMDVFISKLRKYLSQDATIEILNIHNSGFILKDIPLDI